MLLEALSLLKSPIRSVSRAQLAPCVLALCLLAGCDRESTDTAQPQQAAGEAGGSEQLGGMLDRSFVGQAIPAVTVTDPAGATLALDDTGGKPTLLNLWATWCAPCVVEMPLLDKLAGELGSDVRVLTVSEDLQGAEAVVPFFEQYDFGNLPQWMDPNNDLAIAYGGGAVLPLTVLYDADGREVWRVIGGYDWASDEARARVTEALRSPAAEES
jgi:thiol-disulfide isomerase/thioredoxin